MKQHFYDEVIREDGQPYHKVVTSKERDELVMNHIQELNKQISNSKDPSNRAILMQAKSIALLGLRRP